MPTKAIGRFWWIGVVALLLTSQVRGYDLIRNDGGQPVTWDAGSIVMQIKLGSSPALIDGTNYSSSVQAAMQAWNANIVNVQFVPQIMSTGTAGDQNGVNEIAFGSSIYGQSFDANVLAVTVYYYTNRSNGTSSSSQADIVFNSAFTWDSYRGALRAPQDIRRVALHELGHVLGLDHPDQASPIQNVSAVMNSSESNTDSLQPDDIAGAQYLYGAPPTITTQPASQIVYAGQPVQFAIIASGGLPLTYRWQRLASGSGTWIDLSDSGGFSGVSTATLLISTPSTSMNNDQYRCLVTSVGGSAISNAATLTVMATVLPSITSQPSSQSIQEGNSVTFTAAATGVPLPTLQWQKNGVNINGATGSSYTIATVAPGDAASYTVVATNFAGTAVSNAAVLTVIGPPVVTNLSVARQVLVPGQALNLGVTASGTGPITYQWTHNGLPLPGQTSSTLALSSTTYQDSGWYVALVTNGNGTRHGSALFVTIAPLTSQIRAWGNNAEFVTAIPPGVVNTVAISAGYDYHALALQRDGSVKAWGNNFFGQTNVPAGLSDVVAVAGGDAYSLALKSDGTVVGWGYTGVGNLGLSGVVAIAAGTQHSIVLKNDGTVSAIGSTFAEVIAVPAGLNNVISIAAAGFHSLALKSDGTVVEWGLNISSGSVPTGLSGVVAISAGYDHSIALKSDGTVVAWGYNGNGEATVPAGLTGVRSVSGGNSHSLALKNDGTIIGWGRDYYTETEEPAGLHDVWAISAGNEFSFALYDSASDTKPLINSQPVAQTQFETQNVTFSVTAISAGAMTYQWRKNGVPLAGANSATLTITGVAPSDAGNYDVVVSNYLGSTVSATAALTVTPVPSITSLSPARQLAAPGGNLNLAVTATGSGLLRYRWTHNGRTIVGATSGTFSHSSVNSQDGGYYIVYITDDLGTRRSPTIFVTVSPAHTQLVGWGDETFGTTTVPLGLNNVVAVSAGGFDALALKADGTVFPWPAFSAKDPYAGFQRPNFYPYYRFPSGLDNVAAIAQGYYHSLALKANGTVVAWGDSDFGQVYVPTGLTDVVAIAAGGFHSLALKADGTVIAWGANYDGQCTVPTGLANVVAIAAGGSHSLALKSDGTIAVWGIPLYGGNSVPAGLADVTAIGAGGYFSLALKTDGTVVSWGNGSSTTVPANLSNVSAISTGYVSSIAIKSNETLVTWGESGSLPIPTGLTNIAAITGGEFFWILLRDSASVFGTQPLSQTVIAGDPVTFIASANGVSVPMYQWQKDGVNINGATSSSYTIANVSTSDVGSYAVVVTNASGSTTATSNIAILTVPASLPAFETQPLSQIVSVGNPATFIASANGTPFPTYQWQKNGVNISGATSSSYTIANVSVSDAGNYTVVASNSAGNATSAIAGLTVIVNPVASSKVLGDFDGDGKADLVWSNSVTGERSLWFLNGNTMSGGASLGLVPASWVVSATADFDGDGKSDIFWTNTVTGDRAIWLMNGSTMRTNTFMGTVPTDWVISGTGDFNGDGKADLVWTNTVSGDRAMWLMNGSTVLGGGYLGTVPVAWTISGVGDFNGDGKADLVWSNTSTGERSLWFQNGSTTISGAILNTVPVAWVISGVGDFNGDGKADIFLTNTVSGDRAIWLMNGSTITTNAFMGTVPVEWAISGTGDFNGDKKKDLFWTNTATGDRAMWLLNGSTVTGGGYMGTVPVVWTINR